MAANSENRIARGPHLRRLAEVDCSRAVQVEGSEGDEALLQLAVDLLQLCLQDIVHVALAAGVPKEGLEGKPARAELSLHSPDAVFERKAGVEFGADAPQLLRAEEAVPVLIDGREHLAGLVDVLEVAGLVVSKRVHDLLELIQVDLVVNWGR